ncbi:MAG: alpha/beta hydrolase, partial [bacterium]|nr:alpha/beta hydrolase [Candidatus Limimorpha equi]
LYGIIGNTDDREQAASQMKAMLAGFGMPEETIAQTVDPLTSPWMFYFLKYDPTEAIANTNCPTLLLNGSLDLQVLASQNLPAYEKIASDYGKTNMTIREFPGLNHLFQHCTTGSPNEYVNIDETISPEVLQTILEFIKGI